MPPGGADAKPKFSQRVSAAHRARSKDLELASYLRIAERELEAISAAAVPSLDRSASPPPRTRVQVRHPTPSPEPAARPDLLASRRRMTQQMRLATVLILGSIFTSLAVASGGVTISAHGVRVVVPGEWQRIEAASDGPVTDPRTLLVVGTTGVRPRFSLCQIASYRLPPRGAVVVVVGWRNLANSGARGLKPGRAPLKKLVAVHRPSFECFAGRGAVAAVVLDGKAYQVNVMVGDHASRRRVAEALAVARSFDLAR